MSRQRIVAGNWKMHGLPEDIENLVNGLINYPINDLSAEVVVCPPSLYLSSVDKALSGKGIELSAQNVSEYSQGAYTGDLSADMLSAIGCKYSLVGHSERRTLFGESDSAVGKKAKAALEKELTPIVCFGETLEERDANQTLPVIQRQLAAVCECIGNEAMAQVVLAYEPVWAIGTGKTASPEQAQQVHEEIREWLRGKIGDAADELSILYGGSVKPGNAAELFAQPDIDGGLIGGASLKAEDFYLICKAAG